MLLHLTFGQPQMQYCVYFQYEQVNKDESGLETTNITSKSLNIKKRTGSL